MQSAKNNPLVSVITPAYNTAEYIAETLDSVLASDYANIEVIVVDDGSSDNTVNIVKEYMARDERVRLICQANAGPSRARNNAVEHALGEYILPVDSDDIISKHFIGAAVEAIEADSDIMVVTCRCEFFGNRVGEWKFADFKLSSLATENQLPATSLYRRRDWERIGGYNEQIIAREDWAFWIAMLKDGGDVVKLPEVGLYYRVRTASKRFQDRKLKAFAIDKLNRFFPDFFQRELGGKLYTQRSHSRRINALKRFFRPQSIRLADAKQGFEFYMKALPRVVKYAAEDKTEVRFGSEQVTVEEFPVAFGSYKCSAAHKAYQQAIERGEDVVGCYSERRWLLFNKSYLVKK